MITHREALLTLPGSQKLHPLRKKLNLLACHLCGDSTRTEAFLREQPTLFSNPGANHHRNNMMHTSENGKWLLFCTKRQADPICPTISVAVDFLTSLYDDGLSYSSINSARCALSAILESPASAYPTFGEHPDVKRFMKGIFRSRPPLPRYCKTWDVNLRLVLQYIGSMGNSQELSLKDLTLKLVMLVALTTAQRGQSLQLLDTQNMVQEETAYTFMLNSNLKQSKPGKSTSDLVIKLNTYPYDRNLCVVQYTLQGLSYYVVANPGCLLLIRNHIRKPAETQ